MKRKTIQSISYSELDIAAKLIKIGYRKSIEHTREQINRTLKPLYRENINFKESILGEVNWKIKSLQSCTGKNIEEIGKFFRSHGISDFFITENGKRVPISSDKILLAYQALLSGDIRKSKFILYGK